MNASYYYILDEESQNVYRIWLNWELSGIALEDHKDIARKWNQLLIQNM